MSRKKPAVPKVVENRISDRLQKCLDAGAVERLFPLLKDWATEELNLLIADAEALYETKMKAVEAGWETLAFLPTVFLSKKNSKVLDEERHKTELLILAICSEIISVALYYSEVAKKGTRQ